MEPKDPIIWRVIGANISAWFGAIIAAIFAPEFGSSIGWLIDRHTGDNRRDIYWDTGHRPD